MLKIVSIVACLAAALAVQESTTSGFQDFFKKIQDAGSKVDFNQLAQGAAKAQESLGPLISQFKQVSAPLQQKLADSGLVPTTTANPVGGVLKHLQMVGIGSDIDVAKAQENAKKAQDTLGPLFSQFSTFVSKKNTAGSQPAAAPGKSPIDDFIVEDPVPAAPTAAPTPAPAAATSKSSNLQSTFQTIQNVGSKIDVDQVKEGAKKVASFFSQFKNSGTS